MKSAWIEISKKHNQRQRKFSQIVISLLFSHHKQPLISFRQSSLLYTSIKHCICIYIKNLKTAPESKQSQVRLKCTQIKEAPNKGPSFLLQIILPILSEEFILGLFLCFAFFFKYSQHVSCCAECTRCPLITQRKMRSWTE